MSWGQIRKDVSRCTTPSVRKNHVSCKTACDQPVDIPKYRCHGHRILYQRGTDITLILYVPLSVFLLKRYYHKIILNAFRRNQVTFPTTGVDILIAKLQGQISKKRPFSGSTDGGTWYVLVPLGMTPHRLSIF